MTLSLNTVPQYSRPGPQRVAMSSDMAFGPAFGAGFDSGDGANWARVWLTDAPEGSSMRDSLEDRRRNKGDSLSLLVHEGAIDTDWFPDMETGGVYSFTVQEFIKGGGGAGFDGDTRFAPTLTLVGSQQSLTIHIGTRVIWSVTMGTMSFDLEFYVFDDTIRETATQDGARTPRVLTSTVRSTAAVESSTVQTSLKLLRDSTITLTVGDIDALITAMRVAMPTHMNSATFHATADATAANLVLDVQEPVSKLGGVVQVVGQIREALRSHMLNENAAAGALIHEDATNQQQHDQDNVPVLIPVANDAQALFALGMLARSYNAHIGLNMVHKGAGDAVNTVSTTLGLAIDVFQDIFDAMEVGAAAPATVSTGIFQLLTHGIDHVRDSIGAPLPTRPTTVNYDKDDEPV